MGNNRNKRGIRRKTFRTWKKNMSNVTPTAKQNKSPPKKTRSAGSDADLKLKSPATSNKVTKKKQSSTAIDSEDLAALKAEFQNEMSSLKKELQDSQMKYEQQLFDLLNKMKQDNEELRRKYIEKKTQIVSLQKEIEDHTKKSGEQREEITRMEKQYRNSLEEINKQHAASLLAIKAENSKQLTEIDLLQQNVGKLTKEIGKSNSYLICEGKEHSVCLENIKKKYEEELEKQKEDHELVMSYLVSKEEYNYLYGEYEKFKNAFEKIQKKLSKVMADKQMVEKSKLEVIRQKEHQKDEILNYVMNQNRERRTHSQSDTKFNYPSRFRSSQSKFGRSDYYLDDDFAKRPRRF